MYVDEIKVNIHDEENNLSVKDYHGIINVYEVGFFIEVQVYYYEVIVIIMVVMLLIVFVDLEEVKIEVTTIKVLVRNVLIDLV